MAECGHCGRSSSGATYCPWCGQRLETAPTVLRAAGPPGGSPPPVDLTKQRPVVPPPDHSRPSAPVTRARRPVAVMVVAAIVVATLLVVGIAVVLIRQGGSDHAAASERSPGSQRTAGSDAGSSASTVTTASDDPTPSETPVVRCWNGSTAPATGDCAPVAGLEGLSWVFPSYVQQNQEVGCQDDVESLAEGKYNARGCEVPVSGGSAKIVYSYWRSPDTALTHYRSKYGSQGVAEGNVWAFGISYVNGSYQSARDYAGLPFSVTVAADSAAKVQEGLRLVRLRSAQETQGLH